MSRKVQVSLWMIVAVAGALGFLVHQAYLKREGCVYCNTTYWGPCAESCDAVCINHRCLPIVFLGTPTPTPRG